MVWDSLSLSLTLPFGAWNVKQEKEVHEAFEKQAVVFVLGGPGSGKGTQCEKLVEKYGFGHFSTGDMLRKEAEKGTKLGKKIAEMQGEGELVPTKVVVDMIKRALKDTNKERILLDGFPRSREQAEIFRDSIGQPSALLYYECPREVMKDRVMGRAQEGDRSDDNEAVVEKRIDSFLQETVPAIEVFRDSNVLVSVDATHKPEQVFAKTEVNLAALDGLKGFITPPKQEEEKQESKSPSRSSSTSKEKRRSRSVSGNFRE